MTNRVLYLLIGLCLFGCQSMNSIVGTYSLHSNRTIVAHTLVINADSTFNYTIAGDLLESSSAGIWSISEGNLVLNSDESLQPGVIHSIEENDPSVENFSIQVVDEYGSPLSYAAITLNNDPSKGFTLNEKGVGCYNLVELETIAINYLGIVYHQPIYRRDVNSIQLKIRLQKLTNTYLENDEWKIKGSKLINSDNLVLTR